MKYAIVSSCCLFDPYLNPGLRLDTALGLSVTAIERGNPEMLRDCFDKLFSRPSQAIQWQKEFRKCKSWQEAERHLFKVYVKTIEIQSLPARFKQGGRDMLKQLLQENLKGLRDEQVQLTNQVENLEKILNKEV